MQKKIFITLIASGLFSLSFLCKATETVMTYQQTIVSDMSGHRKESPLLSRSTKLERQLTATYIENKLIRAGFSVNKQEYRYRNVNAIVDLLLSPHSGTNVYTTLVATQASNQTVIIGAHYDSVPGSPGAGDNAAGVALLFGVLDRLKNIENRSVNYLFVFFDQEEDDEIGSKVFAEKLVQEKMNVHSVHVSDISAWDNNKDRIISIQSPPPYLEDLYVRTADELGITLNIFGGASSDNKSFLLSGFNTVGVFGDVSEHHHKPTDTYENVDFVFLSLMTDLVSTALVTISEDIAHEK